MRSLSWRKITRPGWNSGSKTINPVPPPTGATSNKHDRIRKSNLMLRQNMKCSSASSSSSDEEYPPIKARHPGHNQSRGVTNHSSRYQHTGNQQNLPQLNSTFTCRTSHQSVGKAWNQSFLEVKGSQPGLNKTATLDVTDPGVSYNHRRDRVSTSDYLNLLRQNRKLKSESEELRTENQKLRNDISTLFHELELTTEVVWKCACHIPYLINLLFDSSIGEKTLPHLQPFSHTPTSNSNNKSPSKRSTPSKKSSGHHGSFKRTTPSKTPLRSRQGNSAHKSQKPKRSSVVANLDNFLDDMYNSMKLRMKENTPAELDFNSLNINSGFSDYGLYVNVDELKGSQNCEPSNEEGVGSNLSNNSNLSNQLSSHVPYQIHANQAEEGPDRPQSADPFRKNSFSTSQSSSSDQVVLKRFSSVPFFEDETDLRLDQLERSRRENSPYFNDTFSDPEAVKTQNADTNDATNNSGYTSMNAKTNSKDSKNWEPREPRTLSPSSQTFSGDAELLRIELSKPTLEKVKCDWINSLREQVKTKQRLSQSHQYLSTILGNFSSQNGHKISHDLTLVQPRKERTILTRPDVIPSIISNDDNSVSSNSNLYQTHESNFLNSWGKNNLHHRKLIHLQSKESVVPARLQKLLKKDPISELVRVINEMEAVIKIHVNSIYLKYIL